MVLSHWWGLRPIRVGRTAGGWWASYKKWDEHWRVINCDSEQEAVDELKQWLIEETA